MNPYEELNLPEDSNEAEIKAAYRKAAQKNHPDKGGDQDKFQMVKAAYDVLSDPERRRRYDETGDTEKVKPAADRVASALSALFTSIIQNEHFNGDMVEEAKNRISSETTNASRMLLDIGKEKTRLEKLSGRVAAKQNNYYQYAIDHRLSEINSLIEQFNNDNELRSLVLKRLDDYVDERPDKAPEARHPLGFAGFGG